MLPSPKPTHSPQGHFSMLGMRQAPCCGKTRRRMSNGRNGHTQGVSERGFSANKKPPPHLKDTHTVRQEGPQNRREGNGLHATRWARAHISSSDRTDAKTKPARERGKKKKRGRSLGAAHGENTRGWKFKAKKKVAPTTSDDGRRRKIRRLVVSSKHAGRQPHTPAVIW